MVAHLDDCRFYYYCGLVFPMGLFSAAALDLCYTYVEGRRLRFDGTGWGSFSMAGHYASDCCYFGIYAPWGYCQFKRWETRNTVFDD